VPALARAAPAVVPALARAAPAVVPALARAAPARPRGVGECTLVHVLNADRMSLEADAAGGLTLLLGEPVRALFRTRARALPGLSSD
jgi:hypothetical protein